MEPKDCPVCGEPVTPHKLYIWHVSCGRCYDGAPDAGPQLFGFAPTPAGAIGSWNAEVAEFIAERAEDAARSAAESDRNARDREYDRQEEAGIDRWRGLE